jgi:hypothetical protein
MSKYCWLFTTFFVLLSCVLVYMFMIRGETLPANDGRTAIVMEEGERDLVLAEMRGFLESVMLISDAVVRKDLAASAAAARKAGVAAQGGVPASLVAKLPIGFKQLGFDTHSRFDQLAMDAEDLGDPMQVLESLSVLLRNCVTCHAAYRIDLTTSD